jgi:hypothetical protein
MNSIGVVDIADSGGRPLALESEGLSAGDIEAISREAAGAKAKSRAGAGSGLKICMRYFAAGFARTAGQSQ